MRICLQLISVPQDMPMSCAVDLRALQRGLSPRTDVLRDITSFGHRRSSRRPMGYNADQLEGLKKTPEYQYYLKRLAMHPKGTPHHVQAQRDLTSAFKWLRYRTTKETIGKKWTENQTMGNTRVQTTGGGPPTAGTAHLRAGQQPLRPRTTF